MGDAQTDPAPLAADSEKMRDKPVSCSTADAHPRYGISVDCYFRRMTRAIGYDAAWPVVAGYMFVQFFPASAFFVVPGFFAFAYTVGDASMCLIPVHVGLAVFCQMACAYAFMHHTPRGRAALAKFTGAGLAEMWVCSLVVGVLVAAMDLYVFVAHHSLSTPFELRKFRRNCFFVLIAYTFVVATCTLAFTLAQLVKNERAWAKHIAGKTHPCLAHARCLCDCRFCNSAPAISAGDKAE